MLRAAIAVQPFEPPTAVGGGLALAGCVLEEGEGVWGVCEPLATSLGKPRESGLPRDY